jgi:two-component system, cell cycle response regulator
MTARILVVDDLLPNRRLLEARLSAEYHEVLTAANGADALAICAEGLCDIVLLDVMMPGMDGVEVCRRLKANTATAHIPVIMVTALDRPSSLVRGLQAGADDFLAKPIDEMVLLARIHSLSRLRLTLDELRRHALRSARLGISDPFSRAMACGSSGGRILLVEDCLSTAVPTVAILQQDHAIERWQHRDTLFDSGTLGRHDLVIVSLDLAECDALRFCARLRSMEHTRHIPVLAIGRPTDRQRVLRGLELGVNDYILRPLDPGELAARVRTQIRQKRYADCLRETVEASLELAADDPLTGLHNRRSLENRLGTLLAEPGRDGSKICALMLDLDHFKAINDRHGHGAGDQVLKTFATRARGMIRHADVLCRLGGDEFALLMPDTSLGTGLAIAEQIRAATADETFTLKPSGTIPVTVSASLAEGTHDFELLRRADAALYRSKQSGRNRVSVDCGGTASQFQRAC